MNIIVSTVLAYLLNNKDRYIDLNLGVMLHESQEGLKAYIYAINNTAYPQTLKKIQDNLCLETNLIENGVLQNIDIKLDTCISKLLELLEGLNKDKIHIEFIGQSDWLKLKGSFPLNYGDAVKKMNNEYAKYSKIIGRSFYRQLQLHEKNAYTLLNLQSQHLSKDSYDGFITFNKHNVSVGHRIDETTSIDNKARKIFITWENNKRTYVSKTGPSLRFNIEDEHFDPIVSNLGELFTYNEECYSSNVGFVLDVWQNFKDGKCINVNGNYISLHPYRIFPSFDNTACAEALKDLINSNEVMLEEFCRTAKSIPWKVSAGDQKIAVYLPIIDEKGLTFPLSVRNLLRTISSRCYSYRKKLFYSIDDFHKHQFECILPNYYLLYLKFVEERYHTRFYIEPVGDYWLEGYSKTDPRFLTRANISYFMVDPSLNSNRMSLSSVGLAGIIFGVIFFLISLVASIIFWKWKLGKRSKEIVILNHK